MKKAKMFISYDKVRGLQNGGIRASIGHLTLLCGREIISNRKHEPKKTNIREMVVKKTEMFRIEISLVRRSKQAGLVAEILLWAM